MNSRQWLSTYAIRNVGVYQTGAGVIGIALAVYDLASGTRLSDLNSVSWILTMFPVASLVVGVLTLRRSALGIMLSMFLQALQVIQLSVPGFALTLMCGLRLRLLVLPRLGPEIGWGWETSFSLGGPSELFLAVNIIPAVLLYFLCDSSVIRGQVPKRAENAA